MRLLIVLSVIATAALAERRSRSPELVVKHNSYKQNCAPGDTWKDQDCNRCYCEEERIAVCTKRKCPGGEKLTPTDGWQDVFTPQSDEHQHARSKRSDKLVVKPDSYADDCKPNDRWIDQDCNECVCGDDKDAVCSRMLCPDGKRLTPTEGWEGVYTPNSESQQQQHHERRKRSENLVVKPGSYFFDCTPGDRWMDEDCNKCRCNDEKKSVCTRKLCSDGKKLTPTEGWEHMFTLDTESLQQHHDDDLACEEGTSWKMDCNTCTCVKGLPACTEMACMPDHSHNKRDIYDDLACEEGTSWKIDCNTCTCVKGLPACTEMACMPDHSHNKRDIYEPMPLRMKRSDSKNWPVKPNSYGDDCEPYDQWMDQDCNKCYCEPDREAVCSKLVCPDKKKREPTPGWETVFNYMKQKYEKEG